MLVVLLGLVLSGLLSGFLLLDKLSVHGLTGSVTESGWSAMV